MGRQGGIGTFLGSDRSINGYADDGKPIWRPKSSLTKKKWLKHPNMGGQRIAARYFRAASVVAGLLWSALPLEMRRLADGGAFNRLVGHCMATCTEDAHEVRGREGSSGLSAEQWIGLHGRQVSYSKEVFAEDWLDGWGQEEACVGARVPRMDGMLVDAEDLRSLNLSVDSLGPHSLRGNFVDGFRLVGMNALCDELDAAIPGLKAGKRSEKYLMAHRFVDDGICRENPDFEAMGSCEGWGKAWRTGQRLGTGRDLSVPSRPVRRVRVWVHAVEVVRTEWNARDQRFELEEGCSHNTEGFVTDWLHLQGNDIPSAYEIQGGRIVLPPRAANGTGDYVVFTTIEVAEKRGRHWVRLPWACKMRISDVVEVAVSELAGSSEQVAVAEQNFQNSQNWQNSRAVLVAMPERVVEGIGWREWDFSELWDYWDRQGVWLDSVMGSAADCALSGEGLVVSGESTHELEVLEECLVRAGP